MSYRTIIQAVQAGRDSYADPAYVEAWLRLMHNGTLDHLSRDDFERDVPDAVAAVVQFGLKASEDLRASYGIKKGA